MSRFLSVKKRTHRKVIERNLWKVQVSHIGTENHVQVCGMKGLQNPWGNGLILFSGEK